MFIGYVKPIRFQKGHHPIIDFDFGDVIWKEFFRVERVPSPGIRVTGGFAFDEIGEIRKRDALADELASGPIEKDLHADAIAVAVDKVVPVTVIIYFVAAIAEEWFIKIESFFSIHVCFYSFMRGLHGRRSCLRRFHDLPASVAPHRGSLHVYVSDCGQVPSALFSPHRG